MSHRTTQHATSPFFLLALAIFGLPALADEPAADPPQTRGEEGAAGTEEVSTKNILEWRTATEVDNFGYYVYRGESEDGPFKRLNDDPIPGAGTTDEPSSYRFVDDDIDLYTTYWYYLESVSMSGIKERFTPVFRKQAKLPREPSEPGADDEGGDDPDQG